MKPRAALAWEHSARTLPFLLFGLAIGVICGFSTYQFAWRYLTQVEFAWILHAVTISIASLGMLYTLSSDDRLTCGIPVSALLLPVTARDLVLIRFAIGITSITVLSVVFTLIQSFYFSEQPVLWWQYAATAAGVFAILQLIAILCTPLGDWSIGILGAASLSTFWYFGVFEYFDNTAAYAAIAVVICPFIAWAVVHFQRHGQYGAIALPRWYGSNQQVPRNVAKLSLIRLLMGSLAGLYVLTMIRNGLRYREPFPQGSLNEFIMYTTFALLVVIAVVVKRRLFAAIHSTEPFRSAADAQRWFELMRLWPLYLSLFSGGLLVQLVRDWTPSFFDSYDLGNWFLALPYKLAWIVGSAAAVSGCVMIFLNFRLQFGSMRAFLYIRPMHSRELATARLLAGVRTLTLPLIIIVLVFMGSELVGDTIFNIEEVIAALCIPWMALWTTNAVVVFAGVSIISALVAEIRVSGNDETYVFGIGAVLLFFVAAGLFLPAQYHKLIHRRWVIALPLLILGVWIGAGSFKRIWSSSGEVGWVIQHTVFTWANLSPLITFALVITMPLLTVPLVTHWARHR